ncbi:MAG: hypothetical protein VR69_01460 [Peptococcaceae bacterium BRH_c4b]|nr:MAG: hypothetical protein VR69_01460 [Peptococcaceae bacterium BRH_c4b]
MSTSKEMLHEMVDALPQEKIMLVKRYLEDLLKENNEDEFWLEADLGDLPPYDWGLNGLPKGKNVKYQPGVGLIVQED